METKNYIKIPTITLLKVSNYPLFDYGDTDHWSFPIIDGINLVLGANSVGKTTMLNMIKFAFAGFHGEINIEYFNERVGGRKSKELIILEFTLNNKLVKISRNLYNGNLEEFVVEGEGKPVSEYAAFFKEQSKMYLSKFVNLLELMLIRIEDGKYILWEKNAQTEIISALLNDVEFQEEFLQAKNEYLVYEKQCKLIENLLEIKRKRKEDLEKSIESEQNKKAQTLNIIEVKEQLSKYKEQRESIDHRTTKLQEKLNTVNYRSSGFYTDSEKKRIDYRNIKIKIEDIEKEVKRLKDRIVNSNVGNKCILCKTTKVTREKAEQIHKQYFIDKTIDEMCPVCKTQLEETIFDRDPKLLEKELESREYELRNLKQELPKITEEYKEAEGKKNDNEKDITNLRESIGVEKTKLYKLDINILDTKRTIDSLEQKKLLKPTSHDIELIKVEEKITDLEKELDDETENKKEYISKLEEQIKKRNKITGEFYKKLNIIFKKYSTDYYVDCDLKFYGSDKKVKNFAPFFKGKIRIRRSQVSHSEAIFLEYLFRVSLLELYCEEAKVKPFLFLETSEGAFDMSNTDSVAKLFSQFAKDRFPVVLVSNLSKQEFIDDLFESKKDKKRRMFNLLPYSRLTPKQAKQLKFAFKW